MIADLEVMDSIMYHIRHHETITDTFGRMYADVGMKMTPVTNDLSFFRSRPYLEEIETHMQHLEAWRMKGRRHVLSTAGEDGDPKKSRKGNKGGGNGGKKERRVEVQLDIGGSSYNWDEESEEEEDDE